MTSTTSIAAITEKLIRRHPHVFGDADAPDAETVLQNWEKLKQAEKAGQGQRDKESVPSLLTASPSTFPP